MFGFVDIILIIIVILFTLSGFFYGFIRTLGNLIGLIIGLLLASWGIAWLDQTIHILSKPILSIVVFLVIAGLVGWLVGFIINLIEGLRRIISIIPFLKSINKLLGGVFGFFEGVITLAAIAFFVQTYLPDGALRSQILHSVIIEWLATVSGIVSWIFPMITTSN